MAADKTSETTITIEEYKASLFKRFDDVFVKQWKEDRHNDGPEMWPDKLFESDWDDQFCAGMFGIDF